MTETEAPPARESINLNPNEHRGHSGQPGTGSPNVNQREHFAQRGVSDFSATGAVLAHSVPDAAYQGAPSRLLSSTGSVGASRPGGVTMKNSRRLAIAGAIAATMLPGTLVLAMPALAVPDPGGSEASGSSASQVQLRRTASNESASKAQIERQELQQQSQPASKAQIERQELQQQRQPAPPASSSTPASDDFPWAIAGLSVLGVAAAGGLGVAIGRHNRQVPAQA